MIDTEQSLDNIFDRLEATQHERLDQALDESTPRPVAQAIRRQLEALDPELQRFTWRSHGFFEREFLSHTSVNDVVSERGFDFAAPAG